MEKTIGKVENFTEEMNLQKKINENSEIKSMYVIYEIKNSWYRLNLD